MELTYRRGGPTIVQAVTGGNIDRGNIDIGYADVPPIISAIARDAPLKSVAMLTNKMDYLYSESKADSKAI